jgi:acyl-coenzyme A synthetase/AMP-(fatty) acid ligase
VSRADDVINSSSYRIGPSEVESVLHEHDALAESAAVASSDELRGNIVKAFVVLADGYEASGDLVLELQRHVREIEFVAELPKTISGKIRRNELRQREAERKASER